MYRILTLLHCFYSHFLNNHPSFNTIRLTASYDNSTVSLISNVLNEIIVHIKTYHQSNKHLNHHVYVVQLTNDHIRTLFWIFQF